MQLNIKISQLTFFISFMLGGYLFAQEECLNCHTDDGLSYKRKGREISLFVDEKKFGESVHAGLECIDCHSDFNAEELPHKEGKDIYKVDCGTCHEDYSKLVKSDIHHRLKNLVGDKGPDCKTCHDYHYVKSPSEVKNKVGFYCAKCHDGNVVLANPYHSKVVAKEKCYECHDATKYQPMLTQSVHSNLGCADCHNFISHNLKDHPGNVKNTQKADCYLCHSSIAAEHRESIHGISLNEGVDEAAMCWNCHGSHKILKVSDPQSQVATKNIAATCGECHDKAEMNEKYGIAPTCPTDSYSKSVHGKVVSEGGNAATCISCHGVHNIKNRIQEKSMISTYNIPDNCGKCHQEITEDYKESIHWIKAKKGVRLSPICTDCHCEHGINAINNTAQPRKEIRKMQEQTCLQCHQNPMINAKYGETSEVNLYQDSYHGLAGMRGDDDAATCVDCHSVHKILPANHPGSTVNEANVTETCKKCHPEANAVFAKSYSHVTQSAEGREIENFVSTTYFWLIVFVIGGMILHNLLIFVFEMHKKRKKLKNSITIPRFTRNEVIQHILLLTSFLLLAITGFALKFPKSFWADGLYQIGLTETIRQNIHRVCAVVMMTLGVYHIIYLFATKRGRDVLRNLIPNINDIKDAVQNILYYLRIKQHPPEFDKYDYAEKAEYWALIWGTIVMGITGLILWFPTFIGDWAPIWLIKVSETIHYYEAILATLAIIVWHWFFVIFHPAEYPMSFTWVDGKMSLAHYRHHHEKHFKKIVKEWFEVKHGKKARKDIKHSSELFISTLEKNGLNADDVFANEIRNDIELRNWLDKEVGGIEENTESE
ncbi:MAG: cytochrome c3 family protein [bacterium]